MVYVLSVAAAVLFAIGSVVQQRAASHAPPEKALSFGLLLYLVRQRPWLVGFASSLVGNIIASAALGMGGVALVQPLFTIRLLFALPLAATLSKVRIPRRDWLGAVATAAGLAAFIFVGRPGRGHPLQANQWAWLAAVVGVSAVVAVLVALSRRLDAARAATVLGVGAGMLFGLQSSLTETAVRYLRTQGFLHTFLHWQPYVLVAAAIVGAMLIQSAYEMAPLPASFPTLVTSEPMTGLIIGVTVLHGSLHVGAGALAAEVTGLLVMVAGVGVLATSSIVNGQLDALQRRREEGEAYHHLVRLERELAALEGVVGDYRQELAAGASCDNGVVARCVHRAETHLQRLDALLADMDAHRESEQRTLRELPQKQRLMLAPLEQELDERQEQIVAWHHTLHREFSGLRAQGVGH